jgi:hypothetical protein
LITEIDVAEFDRNCSVAVVADKLGELCGSVFPNSDIRSMMGDDFRSVLTGGAISQTSLAFYHSDRCISCDELGYFQPLSMADPRLGIQPLCDSTALITMADPTVADNPQMHQEDVAHDGWLYSDYVHATHWPAVHTVNGFNFPMWGRELVYSIRMRSSRCFVHHISLLQLP